MAFALELYPTVYFSQFDCAANSWHDTWTTADNLPRSELQKLPPAAQTQIFAQRNTMPLPGISYTSQYGFGCFEGLKAFPNKSGGATLFRPDRNAARFARSMRGLYCPDFPEEKFVATVVELVRRSAELGYVPAYRDEWEKDNYATAESVYIRPFMSSEGAIGVGISQSPLVVIGATTVSAYFKTLNAKAITTKRVRAMPFGTGALKCSANYVISALAKHEAETAGYMEVLFLDGGERKYLQEGSSCNFFAYLKNGALVTPEIGDTILPGVTRASILQLAQTLGVKTEERPLSLAETLSDAQEIFVTGTAAGVTSLESITHNGQETVFNNRVAGELSLQLQKQLKGIQYGLLPDKFNWNLPVA